MRTIDPESARPGIALAGAASSLASGPSPLGCAARHWPIAARRPGSVSANTALVCCDCFIGRLPRWEEPSAQAASAPTVADHRFMLTNIVQRNFTKANSYNFTTSIGIPRTAYKFDEYEGSPAHRRRVPLCRAFRPGQARTALGHRAPRTEREAGAGPCGQGPGAGRLSGSRAGARVHGCAADRRCGREHRRARPAGRRRRASR